MSFVIAFLTIFSKSPAPEAIVQTEGTEIEAVFVPAGFEGPVVAIPLDVEVF